jgi:Bacterial regulatory proteins, luxR family
MVNDRPRRANGAARPRLSARGTGSRPAAREARRPLPTRGVRPTAIASTVRSRAARSAGASALTPAQQAQFRLSEATVKTHVTRILAKLSLRDRAQAVVVAYETGLITPGAGSAPS